MSQHSAEEKWIIFKTAIKVTLTMQGGDSTLTLSTLQEMIDELDKEQTT